MGRSGNWKKARGCSAILRERMGDEFQVWLPMTKVSSLMDRLKGICASV
jgi:hypothetical protein